MQLIASAAALAVVLLFGLPVAQKEIAQSSSIGLFDPLTCAMSNSGTCTVSQIHQHHIALAAQASAG